MDYVFSESSFPAVNGTLARLEGPYVVETHNCLNFRYHMFGEDIGRLNVYVVYDGDSKNKTLLWHLGGDQREGWNTAEASIEATRPYKVKTIEYNVYGDHRRYGVLYIVVQMYGYYLRAL